MIENLGRNSKKILKPLNTIEGIVYEFLEPLEGLFVCLFSLFKWRTFTTDMHFCYIVYILYSGSQSYIAASFSTVRGYETHRKVFGDPFNGRPLPE